MRTFRFPSLNRCEMRSNITPSHSVRCYRTSCAKRDVSPWGRVKSLGVELAMPIAVAVIGALGAALTVTRTTHRVGFSSHHRLDERAQQFAQRVGAMTLCYPATTHRSPTRGPTRTPPWWTQPHCCDGAAAAL